MMVRALFQAAKVDGVSTPYDTLHLKVFYPAQRSGSDREQDMGEVPADPQMAPFAIVILFNGVNCAPDGYQWLAVKLAERGLVVVVFTWVAENLPGVVALTPGIDIHKWFPGVYGTAPTASALPTLLTKLEALQASGTLAGLLDLQRIILGGHSAGGRVAIENANPQFFPQVVASFAYAAHSAAPVQIGYDAGTILPLPDALPLLLMGGTCDGVIANSGDRYGMVWESATTPVVRTFREAIAGGRDDSYLVLLEGANHFSVVDPFDATTGRAFLDFAASQPAAQTRSVVAESVGLFIDAHVRHQPGAMEALHQRLTSDDVAIAGFERK